MRKLVYILSFIVFTSCINNTKEAEMKTFDFMLIEESINLDDFGYTYSNFNVTNLAQQKLQEYYDLSLLKEQYPEFENDIKLQLENLADSTLEISKNLNAISISNVIEISNQKLSGSVSRIQLQYEVTTEKGTITDTISAIIKTKTIIINNENVATTKLKFMNN